MRCLLKFICNVGRALFLKKVVTTRLFDFIYFIFKNCCKIWFKGPTNIASIFYHGEVLSSLYLPFGYDTNWNKGFYLLQYEIREHSFTIPNIRYILKNVVRFSFVGRTNFASSFNVPSLPFVYDADSSNRFHFPQDESRNTVHHTSYKWFCKIFICVTKKFCQYTYHDVVLSRFYLSMHFL